MKTGRRSLGVYDESSMDALTKMELLLSRVKLGEGAAFQTVKDEVPASNVIEFSDSANLKELIQVLKHKFKSEYSYT
jgi:hypothetical protein